MATTSTVSGTDPEGQTHSVDIGDSRVVIRRIDCNSCAYRQEAMFNLREKAESHLRTAHEVDETTRNMHVAKIVMLVILVVVLLSVIVNAASGS